MTDSLYPDRYDGDFKCVILQHILMIDISSISSEIALGWIRKDFTDAEVMVWCRQCSPSSMSPYGVTGSQSDENTLQDYSNYFNSLKGQ